MDFSSISGIRTTDTALASASGSKKSLDQLGAGDFMTLMLAQLKNQDPMKPTDNTAFIAQMAQLSSVTGINEMKTSINNMVSSLQSAQLLNASSLIGRSVLVPGSQVSLGAGEGVDGQITLPVSAQSVSISIIDASGQVVRSESLGSRASGPLGFHWDGLDSAGNAAPSGTYRIKASYSNGSGDTALDTHLRLPVQSVNLPTGGNAAELEVRGIGTVKLSDVTSIG